MTTDEIKEMMDKVETSKDYGGLTDQESMYWGPIARAYCRPETSAKICDADLALATVKQLCEELPDFKAIISQLLEDNEIMREALECYVKQEESVCVTPNDPSEAHYASMLTKMIRATSKARQALDKCKGKDGRNNKRLR